MPPAHSLAPHQAFLDIWQRALEAPNGLRVASDKPIDLRGRLYHARAAMIRHHNKIYPEDHVMHGKSFYDDLSVRLVPDSKDPTAVEIYHSPNIIGEITEL